MPGIKSHFCWRSEVNTVATQMLHLTPPTLELFVIQMAPPQQATTSAKVGAFGIASLTGKKRGRHAPTIQRFLCIVQKVTADDYEVEYFEPTSATKFHSHQPRQVAFISRQDVQILLDSSALDRRGNYIFSTPPL